MLAYYCIFFVLIVYNILCTFVDKPHVSLGMEPATPVKEQV